MKFSSLIKFYRKFLNFSVQRAANRQQELRERNIKHCKKSRWFELDIGPGRMERGV